MVSSASVILVALGAKGVGLVACVLLVLMGDKSTIPSRNNIKESPVSKLVNCVW